MGSLRQLGRPRQLGRRIRLGALTLALLLTAGHIAFWYWPRARPVDPSRSALAGLALSGESYPLGLWLPYPHQNLGALSKYWGDLPNLAADLAILADAPPPRWLSFGPFAVPPARELAVLVDPEGHRAVAVAQVYPLLALVARAAGGLARNPWLSGGVIEGTEGRIEVRWKGARWQAVSGPAKGPETPFPELFPEAPVRRSEGRAAVLATLRLDGRLDLLPQGAYELFHEEGDWVFASADARGVKRAPAPGSDADPLPDLDKLLVGAARLVAVGDGGEDGATRGLVLYSGSEDGQDPPGFAVLDARPARRIPLAGLGLAALMGSEGHSGRASGWYVLASGERNFLRGAFLVPDLIRLTEEWKAAPGSQIQRSQIRWAAVARPAGVVEVLDVVAEGLARLGPGMEPEAQRTAALARLIRPLSSSSRATLVLRQAPGRTELRVERSH